MLVPVKAFAQAKQRLADVLDPSARRALAVAMAETVLRAAGDLRAAVVCDDDEVRAWAEPLGAEAIWTPGPRPQRRGGGGDRPPGSAAAPSG